MNTPLRLSDLRAVLRSLKNYGVRITFRKVLWALGTRGIYLKVNQNFVHKVDQIGLPEWSASDLVARSKTLRRTPPKSNFKAFAFYLPQFHSIIENDNWWGKGFTEWTNVKKAKKLFTGHYQPHVPLNQNYYDLSNSETMREQARTAKLFGVDAFVMYYYWFDGEKLLDLPLRNLERESNLEFPFVLCWANETWTRNWDGRANEILIEQSYNEGFAEKFIADVAPHFSNSNYQTHEGKPILMVYHAQLIPNPIQTTSIWRRYAKSLDFKDIYLISVNSFGSDDPRKMGFDACTNFAPNNMGLSPKSRPEFAGKIYDYNELIEVNQTNYSDFTCFRSVTPSWDNTARRTTGGSVFTESRPDKFRNWLFKEAKLTNRENNDEVNRIIFINAWNEWAEGCHLEPDEYYGYQWLHAIADVKEEIYIQQFEKSKIENNVDEVEKKLFGIPEKIDKYGKNKIILVVHDMNANGAQMNGLALLREFLRKKVEVELIALAGGKLRLEFENSLRRKMFVINENSDFNLREKIEGLRKEGFTSAIINSAASGSIAEVLEDYDIKMITLVHEFPETITQYKLEDAAGKISKLSDTVVFPSNKVANEFEQVYAISNSKVILPQGLYNLDSLYIQADWKRIQIRQKFNIPMNIEIVIGVGYGDYRKGFDIFCEVAKLSKDKFFLWVGDIDTNDKRIVSAKEDMPNNMVVTGFTNQISFYLSLASCLLLTSRKDPFPSVVLEAVGNGLPVVAIYENTGMDELFNALDLPMAKSDDPKELKELITLSINNFNESKKNNSINFIRSNFNFRNYSLSLLRLGGIYPKTVNVLVPSFNYSEYIVDRLAQIEYQSYSVDKLIFVDDFSTDDSYQLGLEFLRTSKMQWEARQNIQNSGSAFSSWNKAIGDADSDFFWIAEADDVSSTYFLEVLVGAHSGLEALTYCGSKQISAQEEILSKDFAEYLRLIVSRNYDIAYFKSGSDEITECLAIQNTIPNISAVLFDTKKLKSSIEEFPKLGDHLYTAADWLLYVLVLKNASLTYIPNALNAQRRHIESVIGASRKELLLQEIKEMQEFIGREYILSPHVLELQKRFREVVRNSNL